MKKTWLTAAAVAALCLAPASAALFPVSQPQADGETLWGYLDEAGKTVLPFSYTSASGFSESGLAAVGNAQDETALIDGNGKIVVDFTESPLSVDFSADQIAYRYGDHSAYYTAEGAYLGDYPGAVGFFSDERLLCEGEAGSIYVTPDGAPAFDGVFAEAGAFSDGRALVCTGENAYAVIDTAGAVLFTLETNVTPVYYTVFDGNTVVLETNGDMALYSLESRTYLTTFSCSAISEFHEGAAMACQNNRWGIMDSRGKWSATPQYNYLSYMGEGLYAARSGDGSVAAVDETGGVVYRTPEYVGGFTSFQSGLSWHGTADNTLIFFRKNGGYAASLQNAENPTLLTENVVRVTQEGALRYINLATGDILYTQTRNFPLGGGLVANSTDYERFFGYNADGSERSWRLTFPTLSGLTDAAVQTKINDGIRDFFLTGSPVSAAQDSLSGGFGASVEGSVLVVWANCISGTGAGAAVWNDNVCFDLRTGARYTLTDLLGSDYADAVRAALPAAHELYEYSYPRMSAAGVTYYYNRYESASSRSHTTAYHIPFASLKKVLQRDGACYAALQTPFVQQKPLFADVPLSHWAAQDIAAINADGLMRGEADGTFRPDAAITGAEVCVTVNRLQQCPAVESTAENQPWYAAELRAVRAAGLLRGVEALDMDKPVSRLTAMQVFANILQANGAEAVTDTETLLAPFPDAAALTADQRAAAALCIREGLIAGDQGKLDPAGSFTRAQFAKLLNLMEKRSL